MNAPSSLIAVSQNGEASSFRFHGRTFGLSQNRLLARHLRHQ
jgi:hypothetical protein